LLDLEVEVLAEVLVEELLVGLLDEPQPLSRSARTSALPVIVLAGGLKCTCALPLGMGFNSLLHGARYISMNRIQSNYRNCL
jgi:hypothetical protein